MKPRILGILAAASMMGMAVECQPEERNNAMKVAKLPLTKQQKIRRARTKAQGKARKLNRK